DVRTTLMIRNIPNAMTLMQLKALLDRIIPGKYDFLYLRMDFRSRQNVGYAFINLQSAVFIEDLYVIHGRTWTVGMPSMTTKVCMLCYATIQGRDGLIENFRNSAVMLE
ncbi:RNA recognition motif 2, partial [Lineolata rhizophorae]